MNHYFYTRDKTKVLLRKLKPKDAEIVLEYLRLVGGETDFLLFDETGLGVDLEQERLILEQTFNDPVSLLLGCFINDEIVAISNLSVKERLRINHVATIGLSVKKSWWNQGIGAEILKYFIDYSLNSKQIKIIRLEVRTDNLKAINLYKKNGFETVGISPKAIKINDKYYDQYSMIKDLY